MLDVILIDSDCFQHLQSFLFQSYPADCCGEHRSPGEETPGLDQNAPGDLLDVKGQWILLFIKGQRKGPVDLVCKGPVNILVYKDKGPVDLVYKGPVDLVYKGPGDLVYKGPGDLHV